ncbi:MAG: glycosyltransferase [Candidatus Paceibacterota bacterium]
MNKAAVLILTHNRVGVSSKYVPNIVDKARNADILIWDNGSTDGTFEWLFNYYLMEKRITKIFGSDKNYGMEAVNFMVNESDSEYIIKVDDDVTIPDNFVNRLVGAYEKLGDRKVLFMSWDMNWGKSTFATRHGIRMFGGNSGKFKMVGKNEKVYVCNDPHKFMANGVCRLSRKRDFVKIGGHPPGVIYGVDAIVSSIAGSCGYKIAYYSPSDLIVHHQNDDPVYRRFKDKELRRVNSPKNV